MAPLISLMELCQATASNNIEQVYIVTPTHSFLSTDESVNNSSSLIMFLQLKLLMKVFLKVIHKDNALVETLF